MFSPYSHYNTLLAFISYRLLLSNTNTKYIYSACSEVNLHITSDGHFGSLLMQRLYNIAVIILYFSHVKIKKRVFFN